MFLFKNIALRLLLDIYKVNFIKDYQGKIG